MVGQQEYQTQLHRSAVYFVEKPIQLFVIHCFRIHHISLNIEFQFQHHMFPLQQSNLAQRNQHLEWT